MPTRTEIRNCLDREVSKLIRRYNAQCQAAADNRRRYRKRTGQAPGTTEALTPAHWEAHSHFNPFYVRSRLDSFAHAISHKVRSGDYTLYPSLSLDLAKPSGGTRTISVFTIPDAAVSYWLGWRLISRNEHFFSSYSYAYRADRNAHHAIQHLMSHIRGSRRLFLLEYDFAKYFDSISHDYIKEVLRRHSFLVSKREFDLLTAFLDNPHATSVADYKEENLSRRDTGIPQGATISLFLANVACFELDRELERTGAVFARYADDTVIVCDSYEKADRCARLLLDHGDRAGTSVNFLKSPGISLLTPDPSPEMRAKRELEFLGHSLSGAGVRIADRSISRIKAKAARIIYNHLLLQPKRGDLTPNRIGEDFHDWDLVTAVNELRRYVYGRISESFLVAALDGGPVNLTRCAMSFYPTVDFAAQQQLRELDGWLLDTLCRAYTKRVKLLQGMGIAVDGLSRDALMSGEWYRFEEFHHETQLPSFYKSWAYVRKCAKVFGLSRFPSPAYGYF